MKNKITNPALKGSIINLVHSIIVSIFLILGAIGFISNHSIFSPYDNNLIAIIYILEAIMLINISVFSIILIKNALSPTIVKNKTKNIPFIILIFCVISFVFQYFIAYTFSMDIVVVLLFIILPLIIYSISNTFILIHYFKNSQKQ